MTAALPADMPGEWLTIQQAARQLGISASGFRNIAKTDGITVERRGQRPGVRATEINAYIQRARIRPADSTPHPRRRATSGHG
jgi:hypothetical protein